jgi:cell division protein FtsL
MSVVTLSMLSLAVALLACLFVTLLACCLVVVVVAWSLCTLWLFRSQAVIFNDARDFNWLRLVFSH